jgi:hypothetical protein
VISLGLFGIFSAVLTYCPVYLYVAGHKDHQLQKGREREIEDHLVVDHEKARTTPEGFHLILLNISPWSHTPLSS